MLNDIIFYIKKCGLLAAFFHPGLRSLLIYRIGHVLYHSSLRKFNPLWYLILIIKEMNQLMTKMELPFSAILGKRILFVHSYGVVVGHSTQIGDDCIIGPWVVLGHNGRDFTQNPRICNNVYIGAHACVLGGVEIGAKSVIGVSTVVSFSVPENSLVKINEKPIVIELKK